MRVASYNVHACRGRDGRQDIERIAAVLREIDADLIGLQEVECREGRSLVDQAARLAAALAMHRVEGPTLRVGSGWYGNAVLSRWPPVSERNVRFEHHGREARGAVICDVATPDDGLWRVISTHLDLRRLSRRHQLEALLQGLTARSPGPVVLLGDFNEWWPYSGNLAVLRRHLCLPLAPATFPSRMPLLCLDRIAFVDCRLRDLTARSPGPTVLLGDFNEWWPYSGNLAVLRRHLCLPLAPPTFPSRMPVLCLDRMAFLDCRLRDRIHRHGTPQSRVASDHLPIWADLVVAT